MYRRRKPRRLAGLLNGQRYLWFAAFVVCSCKTDPNGFVLATSGATDHVFALDPLSGTVIDSFALDPRPGEIDEPHGIVTSPDGRHWYATLSHGEPSLWKFEATGNRLVGRLSLDAAGASRIGITPTSDFAFIPDYYRDDPSILGEVVKVRLHDLTILGRVASCVAPHDAQVSPDGRLVAVTCSGSNEVVFIEPESMVIAHRMGPITPQNSKPLNLIWAPDGQSVLVTLHHANMVTQLSPTEGVIKTFSVGLAPAQIAISPTGSSLVTANRGDGTLSIIPLQPPGEVSDVDLQVVHPHGVTYGEDSNTVFVAFEGDTDTRGGVAAVDVAKGTILWRREVGTFTLGVTYVTYR